MKLNKKKVYEFISITVTLISAVATVYFLLIEPYFKS